MRLNEIQAEVATLIGCAGIKHLTISSPIGKTGVSDVYVGGLASLESLTIDGMCEPQKDCGTNSLMVENCPRLTKLSIRFNTYDRFAGFDLHYLDAVERGVNAIEVYKNQDIKDLEISSAYFSCSETVVDFTNQFSALERLSIEGELDIKQKQKFTLIVPRGCEVACSDRKIRSMIVYR